MILRDERYLPTVHALLREARTSVRVSLYNATLNGHDAGRSSRLLLEELRKAARRKCTVQVLLNAVSPARTLLIYNNTAAQWLLRKGCQVRKLPHPRCLHAKLVTVDDRVAVIGSHNWSYHALRKNAELSWRIEDPDGVREVMAYFGELWRKSVPWEAGMRTPAGNGAQGR